MSNTTVTLEAKPLGKVIFHESEDHRWYEARSADGNCSVHMQTERIATRIDMQGAWYGSESRKDQHGVIWKRSLGYLVQDDFGMLVEVNR